MAEMNSLVQARLTRICRPGLLLHISEGVFEQGLHAEVHGTRHYSSAYVGAVLDIAVLV